tara:strand:- start:30 stop:410 length:381 start_codon:yes stop_codon:yes gene_type:complete
MKLSTTIGNYTVEVEGETQEELFGNMAEMAELLSAGATCGKSGQTDTIPRKRVSGEYTFFEWFCVSSGAALALGQKKNGGFFPKRKDKNGEYLDNNGWQTWSERKQEMQPAQGGDWSPGDNGGTPF